MTAFTEDQTTALFELQDSAPEFATWSAPKLAARLKADGHPLFADYGAASNDDPITFELTKPEEQTTAMARPRQSAGGVEGMEDLGLDDFVVPQLKLKQAMTKDKEGAGIADVPNGFWFLTHEPESNGKVIDVVLLDVKRTRAFLLPYNQDSRDRAIEDLGLDGLVPEDVQVICSSPDRVTPDLHANRDWPPMASACRDCEHSRWRQSKGRRLPPACGEEYRCVVVDQATGTPARLLLRSSAIAPAKRLLSKLNFAGRRHGLPMFGFSIALTSKATRNARDEEFYVPVFGAPSRLEDHEVEEYRAMREDFLAGGAA